jgi:hypothetical protein
MPFMNVKPATKRYGFLLLAAALPTLNLGMAQTKNPEVKPEAKCQIEGTVVNAMTGEPLKKAHLSLRPYAQRSTPYGAITDKTGHFLLDDVDPGQYVLIA